MCWSYAHYFCIGKYGCDLKPIISELVNLYRYASLMHIISVLVNVCDFMPIISLLVNLYRSAVLC